MQEEKRESWRETAYEIVKFTALALLIVIPFRLFVAQPYIVSGESMADTFSSGEYLIVDQLSYRFSEPKRGDVIIFRFPLEPSKFFIKRIIGLPGERVRIQNGAVTIVNAENPEGIEIKERYLSDNFYDTIETIILGGNDYYVLGDNRRASLDSRAWGPLDKEYIIGRAFISILPVAHAGFFPGAATYPSEESTAQ